MMYIKSMPLDLLQVIITFRVLWITHAIFTVDRYVIIEELGPWHKSAIVLLEHIMLVFNSRAVFV